MREIHVRVSSASRSTVESLLDDRGIDYTTLVEGEEVHVYFPLPTAAVSTVLDDFEEAHIDSGSYTVLRKVEFVQTPNFEALRERQGERPQPLDAGAPRENP